MLLKMPNLVQTEAFYFCSKSAPGLKIRMSHRNTPVIWEEQQLQQMTNHLQSKQQTSESHYLSSKSVKIKTKLI